MARVDFGQLYLNRLRDLSDYLGFDFATIEYDDVIDTATTQMAGGNFATDALPGFLRVAKIEVNFLTDAEVKKLRSWYRSGEPLVLRAPTGDKFSGTIDPGQVFTPRAMGDSWSAPFSFTEFTYSEEAPS